MDIAVIGSGISGLACAHYLHREHQVTVYEAADTIGGHTATVDVALGGRRYAIDTGFIVYNDRTYPNFINLLENIGVASQTTSMSFSVSDKLTGLEYAGSTLATLFAQKRNLVSPGFIRMVQDILRFNRESQRDLIEGRLVEGMTLGEYLASHRYSRGFIEQYLIPMGSAIWSADTTDILEFPLQFFLRFFRNHGLLALRNRPQWRVIQGGSREYLQPLSRGFADRIHTASPVREVKRNSSGVDITLRSGAVRRFDQVVLACHSNQALSLLTDPSPAEHEILSAIPYRDNEVVLHTDVRLLPRNTKTWAAWNYLRYAESQRAILTYNMNILQGLEAPETFCVTLNNTEDINPHKILGRFNYAHPVFTLAGMRAQQRWQEINGPRTWYAGAYWANGFHEDGVVSALRVARGIGTAVASAHAAGGVA